MDINNPRFLAAVVGRGSRDGAPAGLCAGRLTACDVVRWAPWPLMQAYSQLPQGAFDQDRLLELGTVNTSLAFDLDWTNATLFFYRDVDTGQVSIPPAEAW